MFSLHEKYIVDEKGKKTGIVLSHAEWKKILEILEEYEDICAYDKAKSKPSDPVPFPKILKKSKKSRS